MADMKTVVKLNGETRLVFDMQADGFGGVIDTVAIKDEITDQAIHLSPDEGFRLALYLIGWAEGCGVDTSQIIIQGVDIASLVK